MKKSVPLFLISAGLLLLVVAIFARLGRERDLLKRYIDAQQRNMQAGVQTAWQEKVLADANHVDAVEYSFVYDPVRQEVSGKFFPVVWSHLNWDLYRVLNSDEARKKYLETAMNEPRSWDRALAINEWNRRFGPPVRTDLTEYEKNLIEPERARAYETMFRCLNNLNDMQQLFKSFQLKCVLIKEAAHGQVMVALPSLARLKKEVLPSFLLENKISSAEIDEANLFQLTHVVLSVNDVDTNRIELVLYLVAVCVLFVGIVVFVFDMRKRAQEIDRRVSFLNQIVHELRTPLAGLKLHAQLAKKYGVSAETLVSIDDGVSRMGELFEKILSLNTTSGSFSLENLSASELEAEVNLVAGDFKNECKVTNNLAANEVASCNRNALTIILKNLIANGLAYGTEVDICLSASGKNQIEIAVSDNGPGVLHQDGKAIFQSFYRGKNSRPDGLGLGLFISQKFAKQMKARLFLKNPGKPHATFVLSLRRVHT